MEAGYARLRSLLSASELELPPVANVRTDLQGIRQRATAGSIKVVLEKQTNGRHCDFAPSIALLVNACGSSEVLTDGSLISVHSDRSLTPGVHYHGDGMIDTTDSEGILGEIARRRAERLRRLANDTIDD